VDAATLARLGWRGIAPPGPPARDRIQLWLVRVPAVDAPLEPLLAWLTRAERERAGAKRIAEKRVEYVTGQAALRALVARALAATPSSIRYRRGIKGKPYLAPPHDAAGLQFNLTHSGGVVGVALATGREVGLDIEWHNERTRPERVASRAFTEAERGSLAAMPPQRQRRHFFQLWTCKEALVKCTGLGIHSGMTAFQIALDPRGGARVSGAWGRQAGVEALRVVPLALGDGHAGALVHEPPDARLDLHLLDAAPDPLASL
jgi:4'-phosphopantetheinyl transferase